MTKSLLGLKTPSLRRRTRSAICCLKRKPRPRARALALLPSCAARRSAILDLAPFDANRPALPPVVTEQVEIQLKYAGYIDRQLRQVKEFSKMENRRLPEDLDYATVTGLRIEARQKLQKIRPENFGQASRISGVSPADVAALMVFIESRRDTRSDHPLS